MSYTINPNAKNKWARNAENTMDLSLETDASSIYLDDGRTLEQELGEGSMVSNVATVDSSMSKVIDGTLNGAYESGVMYGKTMVNGLSNPKIQQGREYITMVSPTHLIINHGENLSEKKINVNYDWLGGKMEDGADYTLDIWILKNTMHRKTDPKATIGKFNFNNYNTGFYGIPANTLGHITYEVTTSNVNTGGKPYIETFTTCEGELEIQIVIRQGKNLVPIEQHFEGICDVKMPILRNTGKNLFDGNLEDGALDSFGVPVEYENRKRTGFIKIKQGETYTISGCTIARWCFYTPEKEFITTNTTQTTKPAPMDGYIRFSIQTNFTHDNIQLEESSSATSYEDHKTNILHAPETVTLRSLPNGVRDELNLNTGEYIKRIGEIVLNGSEDWEYTNETFRSRIIRDKVFEQVTASDREKIYLICDKYKSIAYSAPWNSGEFIALHVSKQIVFRDERFNEVNDWKQYLSQNPVMVQYQLAIPITTTIEPLSIPFAYKNGHVIVESGFEGQSLLPTLEYSTVVNRTGQVESVAKTIQAQEKQLTMLEKMLIQNIINLDYNNTLLTLKNEMEEML